MVTTSEVEPLYHKQSLQLEADKFFN